MTVTTTDIERLAVKLRAEIDALSACAPAHADMIAAAVLVRLAGELGGRAPGRAGSASTVRRSDDALVATRRRPAD